MSGAAGSSQWMYASGYEIDQSLRFSQDKASTLTRTASQAPTNNKIGTWSFWVKKTEIIDDNEQSVFQSRNANNAAGFVNFDFHYDNYENSGMFSVNYSGGNACLLITKAQYNDPNAWYHIVIAYDSTQGTASDRVNLYVNGEKITEFHTETYPDQNRVLERWGESGIPNNIGSNPRTANRAYFDGYLAEFHYVDGQQLTQASFGETGSYGEWKPIEYGGTYGNNGFYLPFKNDSTVEGFNTVVYKGQSSNQYVGGVGFKPDFVWIKKRNSGTGHSLSTVTRGVGKSLFTENTSDAEDVGNNLLSFNPDGFTANAGSSRTGNDGDSYVAWCWDMGDDTPTGFGSVTYKGNGAYGREIRGVGFEPDLVWIKSRGSTHEHILFDTIRGPTKNLTTVTTAAEWTNAGGLTSFKPDGFSLGSWNDVNSSSYNYVAWCWDMGDTSVTNTSGSISSQVRANPTYGQSIVSYTGTGANATVGHGLSSAPDLVIYKNRDDAGSSGSTNANWIVQSTAIGADEFLELNDTAAKASDSGYFNSTRPSSSVLTLGAYNSNNGSSDDMIAYCFHSVSGYSKFGSYTGDGNLSGPSVTLGFRPAWVMIRKTDSADWLVFDSTRNPLNEARSFLEPNTSDAEAIEQTSNYELGIDLDSNGFQIKARGGGMNGDGATYLYAAFAGGYDSATSYNTDGNIDSRVKANATYGQSLVHYKGTAASSNTVGHGLSSAPEFMIVRCASAANAWAIYHKDIGNTHLLEFSAAAKADNNEFWNDTTPTSSVFTIGSHNEVNTTEDFQAWCFHSVTGYSKVGSFTGTGSASAITISCGFKPAFIMMKVADASSNRDWYIWDDTRSLPIAKHLRPNLNNAEAGEAGKIEFTSSSVIITTNDDELNSNGDETVYIIFADKKEFSLFSDASGNGNHFISENGTITESDIVLDTPSNNFSTLNPHTRPAFGDGDARGLATLNSGNLRFDSVASQTTYFAAAASFDLGTSGKWYSEFLVDTVAGNGSLALGITFDYQVNWYYAHQPGETSPTWGYNSAGSVTNNNSAVSGTYASYTVGDIIQLAVDLDNDKFYVGKNNVWQEQDPADGNGISVSAYSGEICLITCGATNANQKAGTWNFGQDSSFAGKINPQGNGDYDFFYEPPTGYKALCQKDLPAVIKPQENHTTILYDGTGSSASHTLGFRPNFVWGKKRNGTQNHWLIDDVSGGTDWDRWMTTEGTNGHRSEADGTTFDANGFTTASNDLFYNNGANYVVWAWKGNGTGTPVTNTNGNINSTVSANTAAGFSLVKYVGVDSQTTTVGHGLTKAPEMIWVKAYSEDGRHWRVFLHTPQNTNLNNTSDATDYYRLNQNTATTDDDNYWNDTVPTTTVFSVGDANDVNDTGCEFIAWCWHSVDGYSKVGNYRGNGNANGPFVHTGFRPSFIMLKQLSGAGDWYIYDLKRDGYNYDNDNLRPAYGNAENTDNNIGIYSNGFRMESTNTEHNASGQLFAFIAFAEVPLKYANAR